MSAKKKVTKGRARRQTSAATPSAGMSNDTLFRLAGISVVPVHRDGKTYHKAHPDSATSLIVTDADDLAALIRDWWRAPRRDDTTPERYWDDDNVA